MAVPKPTRFPGRPVVFAIALGSKGIFGMGVNGTDSVPISRKGKERADVGHECAHCNQ
jgi:hypothetical protein